MDNKTLEYMGERVDKARKLAKNIATIDDYIKHLNVNTLNEVRLSLRGGGIYLDKSHAETDAVLPLAKDAIAQILVARRDQLQRELDEL
jgi:hypothetical protein